MYNIKMTRELLKKNENLSPFVGLAFFTFFCIIVYLDSFDSSNTIITISKYILLLGCIGIFFLLNIISGKLTINKKIIFFILPYILIAFFSLLVGLINDYRIDYITRGFSTCLYLIIIVVFCFSVSKFKQSLIKILILSIYFVFTWRIILTIMNYGFFETITDFLNDYDTAITLSLELHDINLTLPLVLVYSVFINRKIFKHCISRISNVLYCLFLIIICSKRIMILAFFALVFIYIFEQIFKLKKKELSIFFLVVMFLISFIYIILIKSGGLFSIINYFNINTMSRMQIYQFVNDLYSINPLYFGKGMSFLTKYLIDNRGTYFNGIFITVGGVHNDVLRMYIEYGFIGFFLYFYYYFCFIPKKYINNPNLLFKYMLLCVFTTIGCFTDALSTYFLYQIFLNLIIFSEIIVSRSPLERDKLL